MRSIDRCIAAQSGTCGEPPTANGWDGNHRLRWTCWFEASRKTRALQLGENPGSLRGNKRSACSFLVRSLICNHLITYLPQYHLLRLNQQILLLLWLKMAVKDSCGQEEMSARGWVHSVLPGLSVWYDKNVWKNFSVHRVNHWRSLNIRVAQELDHTHINIEDEPDYTLYRQRQ